MTMRLSLSPDGALLAAVGQDRSVKVWDLRNNEAPRSFGSSEAGLNTVLTYRTEFSPDGRTLLQVGLEVGNGVKPMGVLWDVAKGQEQKRLELQAAAGGNAVAVSRAVIAPDLRMLALPLPDSVTVVSIPDGKELVQIKGIANGYMQTFLFSRDGKTLICGGWGNDSLNIWELPSGKLLRQFGNSAAPAANAAVAVGRGATSAALSPDEKTLLTIDGPAMTLTDLATGKRLNESAGHTGLLKEAFFTAKGDEVWTRGSDYRLRRWNAATGAEVGHIDAPDPTASCLLSPNGQWLGTSDRLGNIRLIDVATMKEKQSFAPEAAGMGCNIEFSPDSKSLAVVSRIGRSGFLYDVAAGKMRLELPLPPVPLVGPPMIAGAARPVFISSANLPRRLMFSRDSRSIAISSDGFITVWDAAHGRQIGQISCDQHDLLRHAALSPDSRTIAVERSATTTIWELATNSKRQVLESSKLPIDDPGSMRLMMLGTAAFPMTLAYSPDGRLLARAGEDRKIRLWDAWTGKEVGSFEGHRGALVSASFAPDGNRLVTASTDTTALVWDVAPLRVKLPRTSSALNEKQIAAHWQALLEPDGAKAFEAIQALAGDPTKSVALLSERIKLVEGPDLRAIAKLTADLSDAKYATRERARKELEHLGEAAAPALRQTVESSPSAEARSVAKKLLDGLHTVALSGERLRAVRAVEVLERLGTPEAIELLKKLAGGAAEMIPTPQAQSALERLGAKR